jgi:AcrR family transcriptional regulator
MAAWADEGSTTAAVTATSRGVRRIPERSVSKRSLPSCKACGQTVRYIQSQPNYNLSPERDRDSAPGYTPRIALPTTSPLRTSREERRQTISRHYLEVLPALLNTAGFSDLSVEQLITAGSISRASFYRYFDDKHDLLTLLMQHVADDLMDAGDAWWTLPVTASKGELEDAHRDIVGVYRRHRQILRAVVEATGSHAGLRDLYDAMVTDSINNVHAHIELGQREGFIAPHLRPRETAELLVYLGERSLFQIVAVRDETDDTRYPDPLAELYWRTLYEGYRDPNPVGRR